MHQTVISERVLCDSSHISLQNKLYVKQYTAVYKCYQPLSAACHLAIKKAAFIEQTLYMN
jgi:hypothetical protein